MNLSYLSIHLKTVSVHMWGVWSGQSGSLVCRGICWLAKALGAGPAQLCGTSHHMGG